MARSKKMSEIQAELAEMQAKMADLAAENQRLKASSASSASAKTRKPRRSKIVAPTPTPTPTPTKVTPSSEGLALMQYRANFKRYCAGLIRTDGKSASPGSDSGFNEAAVSLGQTGFTGARMAVLMFLHHIRTGQVMSKLDLARQGIVTNHLHYQKLSQFLATVKK